MKGYLVGVFSSRQDLKTLFLGPIAKKSETEGLIVYHRNEAGVRFSFLDDSGYPEKFQGYAKIASICDYAYYLFPPDGKLTPSDGELAVLLDSLSVNGSIELLDVLVSSLEGTIKSSFKGLSTCNYPMEERNSKSSTISIASIKERNSFPKSGTIIYIDRAFNVKGVGLVVLGFVLSGKVSVHDRLRLIPGASDKQAEVKGIQISDEDFETAERGIRVGLSLKGVEMKDIQKTSWLDDGTCKISKKISFSFAQSKYYRQSVVDRNLHLECVGEMLPVNVTQGSSGSTLVAELSQEVPIWENMPVCIIDLNSKPLRIAGGGKVLA